MPIYALDQLIAFGLLALPLLWLTSVNWRLAPFAAVGAYVGAVLTMQRSTPASMLLAHEQEGRIVDLLDGARLLKRSGEPDE